MSKETSIMDLSKAKFEIIKIEGYDDLGYDCIDLFHLNPESDHLCKIASGQYSVEEGRSFGCESEEDMDKYEEILSQYDSTDPVEIEEAYKALENAGFTDLGTLTSIKFFKKVTRPSEYVLVLKIDESQIITVAASSSRRLLQQYKKLIDNPISRFKLRLISESDPAIIGTLKELHLAAQEDALECKIILNKMDLS